MQHMPPLYLLPDLPWDRVGSPEPLHTNGLDFCQNLVFSNGLDLEKLLKFSGLPFFPDVKEVWEVVRILVE